jgi:CheY-like chemotaxis protein
MATLRILVADDDAWILRMVTTVLEKRGYQVETAADGEEAYEKAIAQTPDLVITDVMMPGLDGWALVKALRARPEFAFVPVIFLTALGSDDDRIRGFRLGADDYLPKPFRFEELDLRVANALKRRVMVEQLAREQIQRGGGGGGQIITAPPPPTESRTPAAGLTGRLDQVGLPALLTLLEMERKSGILTLTRGDDGEVGRIFVRQGRVIQARVDSAGGPANEDCVYHLLAWDDGRFAFTAVEIDMDDQVRASTTHLLMEGARRLDELAQDT